MGKLTAKLIDNLTEPRAYDDGSGLRLIVRKGGTKGWVWRYQMNGRRRDMGIGSYPALSLKEARLEAARLAKVRAQGIDPLDERKQARALQRKAAARVVTFQQIADEYIEQRRSKWKGDKHHQQWQSTLNTYAMPIIGHLSPDEVTTEHVLTILKPIWSSKPELANRVRNRVELILDAATVRKLRDGDNPARWRGHLSCLLPVWREVAQPKNHPALPYADLPAFMHQLSSRDDLSSYAMRFTILTACRTSEALKATWGEFDLEGRVWTIPPERMKVGKTHRVPLSDAVLALLAQLPRIEGSPYLFPSRVAGKPLSNMAMLLGLRRMGRSDITMHGFRSTFRDWAAECTSYPREVCEMALAHTVAGSVEAAYWRGDLLDKRRELMQDWGEYATRQPTSNVVQGSFKRG